VRSVDGNRPRVDIAIDDLDARDRAGPEIRQHRRPVVRRFVAQLQRNLAPRRRRHATADAAQRSGRTAEEALERFVEASNAAKARGERHLAHRQRRLVDELLGEQDPSGLRDRDGRRTEVCAEQPAELAFADAEPRGECVHIGLVQSAELDERQSARHGVRRAAPGGEIRCRFGPAAQTRPEAGGLRGRRRGEEAHVLALGRPRRTDGTAVDAGRLHADEQLAVEACVAGPEGAVAGVDR